MEPISHNVVFIKLVTLKNIPSSLLVKYCHDSTLVESGQVSELKRKLRQESASQSEHYQGNYDLSHFGM